MGTRKGWDHRLLAAMLTVGLAVPSAFAAAGAMEKTPRVTGMLRKLGRGIANIATCPAEIARTSEMVTKREGHFAGLTVGLLQGAWRTVLRGVTGTFEVLTFYVEIPDDYGPLMKPEFVWAHGGWVE